MCNMWVAAARHTRAEIDTAGPQQSAKRVAQGQGVTAAVAASNATVVVEGRGREGGWEGGRGGREYGQGRQASSVCQASVKRQPSVMVNG